MTITVIFVGVHNKKGMKPLDSSTLSGKRVDMIIAKIGNIIGYNQMNFEKTNLFDSITPVR